MGQKIDRFYIQNPVKNIVINSEHVTKRSRLKKRKEEPVIENNDKLRKAGEVFQRYERFMESFDKKIKILKGLWKDTEHQLYL